MTLRTVGTTNALLTSVAACARIRCVDGEGGGRPDEPDTERAKQEDFGGLHWEQTPHVSAFGVPGGWAAWLTGSRSARRVASGLAVADDRVGGPVGLSPVAAKERLESALAAAIATGADE